MIVESGVIVFVGLLLLLKLPQRTALRLLGRPLALDLAVSVLSYVLQRVKFTEVMAAVAGLTCSGFTASMLRDIENGGRIEADHVVGDLIARAGAPAEVPLLRLAYTHLKAYEARRRRTAP